MILIFSRLMEQYIEICLFYLYIIKYFLKKYFYKNCTDKRIHYTVFYIFSIDDGFSIIKIT